METKDGYMSERRIITFEQLHCAVEISSPSNLKSLFFDKLPDGEPVIEAATKYEKMKLHWDSLEVEQKLKITLDEIGVK